MSPERSPRHLVIVLSLLLTVVLAGACALAGLLLCSQLYPHLAGAVPTRTENAGATLVSPLASVQFPEQRVDYPADWPPELRYPEAIALVEARSGPMVGGEAKGWVMKHRCPGTPSEAAELLTSWMAGHGWVVIERLTLDSDGLVLLVERAAGGSGIVNIGFDPTRPGSSLVASTFMTR